MSPLRPVLLPYILLLRAGANPIKLSTPKGRVKKYCGYLNTKLVWYLNGGKEVQQQMVQDLNPI